MDAFQSWDDTFDNLPVEYAVSKSIPADYVLGPVCSSETLGRYAPHLWFVGLNYREEWLQGPGEPIPAILQVWRPESSDSPAVLVQQFEIDNAVIQEMGLIQVDHTPVLYVITGEFNLNGTLACFQIRDDLRIDILSEEHFRQLIWYQSMEDWGPTFVYFGALPWANTYGDWRKEILYFITYSEHGFFASRGVYWGDVLDREEVTRVSNADDFRCIASYKLKMTNGWRSKMLMQPPYGEWPVPEEHINSDGSKYFCTYQRWREVPLAEQSSVGK
jgi:hypothetical protein